jgi:MoaA/NifB/PqqE/SkfB family radical SAM enzyme
MGMFFFTFSGGECFTRPDLLDLWGRHDDCYFQVYTNGTLIDDGVADRLADMGNVAPMISVEGGREETDSRRGSGVYDKVMEAFSRLKDRGVPFGFSSTLTKESARSLLSDDFIETMYRAGCRAGWFFQYVPTGRAPELAYMATPQQRFELHRKVTEWRKRYPIFLGDFWNDGPFVDGCMAGGERYLHVIANGDVEPCVFCHFAVDNIREKPLREIVRSPFFSRIREAQPYDDDDLLRPCLIIDHPATLREIVSDCEVRPTHRGAEGILTELAPGLDRYAAEVARLFDPLWEGEEKARYLKSLEKEDKPEVHQRFRRRQSVENRS